MKSIYLIGALKNWDIPQLANDLEKLGYDVFADWLTPGPEADSFLLRYAKERGWNYEQALQSFAAKHVFDFDKKHLDRCDCALAIAPFGKSAMLELGYTIGRGKPGFIFFPTEPERFDVMLQFATKIFFNKEKMISEFARIFNTPKPGSVLNLTEEELNKLKLMFSIEPFKFNYAEPFIPFDLKVHVNENLASDRTATAVNATRDAAYGKMFDPRTFEPKPKQRIPCPAKHKWAFGETSDCSKEVGHKDDHRFEVALAQIGEK